VLLISAFVPVFPSPTSYYTCWLLYVSTIVCVANMHRGCRIFIVRAWWSECVHTLDLICDGLKMCAQVAVTTITLTPFSCKIMLVKFNYPRKRYIFSRIFYCLLYISTHSYITIGTNFIRFVSHSLALCHVSMYSRGTLYIGL
jgi:hypothetical protein